MIKAQTNKQRPTGARREQKMSSYTIAKKEYVKVAGYIAGIAEAVSRGMSQFWIYDFREGQNTTKEIFYKRFCECYQMNAASVKEQYHGDEVGAPSNDQHEYKRDFEDYYKKGKAVIYNGTTEDQKKAVAEIQRFLGSSLYQTENEKYNFMMTHWYFQIIEQLTEKVLLRGVEPESWGDFEAPELSSKYQVIA